MAIVLHTGKESLRARWHWSRSMRPGWLSTAPVSRPKTDVASPYSLWCCSHSVARCCRKWNGAKNWGIWCGFVLAYVFAGLPLTVLCFFSRRSRLADYMVNCWVTPHTVSTCPNQDNHQACLASYARLIGQWNKNPVIRICMFSPHMFLIHYARLCENYINFLGIVRIMHDRSWACTTFRTIHSARNQLFVMLVAVQGQWQHLGQVFFSLEFSFACTEFYNLINCPKVSAELNEL